METRIWSTFNNAGKKEDAFIQLGETSIPVHALNGCDRKESEVGEGRPGHMWYGPQTLLPDW